MRSPGAGDRDRGRPIAGKPVKGRVDAATAGKLAGMAAADGREPGDLVGDAVSLYLGLPDAARTALRRFQASANADERRWFDGELVRLLMKANFAATQRVMAAQVGDHLPKDASDAAIDAEAERWLKPSRE